MNRNRLFRVSLIIVSVTLYAIAAIQMIAVVDIFRAKKIRDEFHGYHFAKKGKYLYSVHPRMISEKFLVNKPQNQFRIFVLGGSEAMGTPYVHQNHQIMAKILSVLSIPAGISNWLERYLNHALDDNEVKVINAAKGGLDLKASIRTYKEIIRVGTPDMVVILSGNNERFYPPVINGFTISPGYTLDDAVRLLSAEYKKSMDKIVALAEEAKVVTYILTVPTNLKGWFPSAQDPVNKEIMEVQQLIENGEFQLALNKLQEEENGNQESLTHFFMGQIKLHFNDVQQARTHFLRAKDRDTTFLRCRSDWNNIARELKGAYVRTVDMESIMMNYGEEGIPGFDLFHDYCHLNLQGNQIFSFELASIIQRDLWPESREFQIDDVLLEKKWKRALKFLYFLKKVKWIRTKYYTDDMIIRDLNSSRVRKGYRHTDKK